MVTEDVLDPHRLARALVELADASLIEVQFDTRTRYHYLDLVHRRAEQLLDDAHEHDRCNEAMVRWAVAETDGITYESLARLLAELPNLVAAAEHACARWTWAAALRITGASFVLLTAERGTARQQAHRRPSPSSPAPTSTSASSGAAASSCSASSSFGATCTSRANSPSSC